MAIVVEEERSVNRTGIVNALIWLVIIALIVAGLYYIFFKRPEAVEILLPKNTDALSKIDFNFEAINRTAHLQEYIPETTPPQFGVRANPFIGF